MNPTPNRYRPTWKLAVPLAVILLVIANGPRASIEPELPPGSARITRASAFPESLSAWPAWLQAHEQRAGVTDTGTMARVVFATPSAPARTPWSVVYLHGFSATRQETAPVSEQVAAALGANLFEARLRGHGLPGDSMGVATARDWIAGAEDALALGTRLGDSVLVIATSTGGTLAAWLAAHPDVQRGALRRIALISPNFGVNGATSAVLSWPWAPVVLPRLIPSYSWTPRNEAHGRYWTTSYPSRALFPMTALVDAVHALPLREWTIPTLLLYNRADPVVDASAIEAFASRLGEEAPARVEVEPITPASGEDGHVIAGRITAPSQVTPFVDRIVRFVRGEPAR